VRTARFALPDPAHLGSLGDRHIGDGVGVLHIKTIALIITVKYRK
jgi:hypothetical protein